MRISKCQQSFQRHRGERRMGELWIFPVNYPFNVERKQEEIDRDVTYDRKFLQLGKTSAYERTSLAACLVNTHTLALRCGDRWDSQSRDIHL